MRPTIKVRLWAGFAGMAALVAAVALFARSAGNSAARTTRAMIESNAAEAMAAKDALGAVAGARLGAAAYLLHPSPGQTAEVDAAAEQALAHLKAIAQVSDSEERRAKARELAGLVGRYRETFAGLAALQAQRGYDERSGVLGALSKSASAVDAAVTELGLAELSVCMSDARRLEAQYLASADRAKIDEIGKKRELFEAQTVQFSLPDDTKKSLGVGWDAYRKDLAALVEIDARVAKAKTELSAIASEAGTRLDGIVREAQAETDRAKDRVLGSLSAQGQLMLAALLAALAVAGIVGALTARSIVRPVHALVARFRDIARGEGDLTQEVDASRRDELGDLGGAFNEFLGNIRGVIAEAARAAGEVAAGSEEIAATCRRTTEQMNEHSGQVARISAGVEQTSAAAKEMSERSARAAEGAARSGELALRGGEVVEKTIAEIAGVRETVSKSASTVGDLDQRGQSIGQIIAVINDIAEQTNLLALNAAIEAARAGEHGRGFAVVADEVRKLADRTTQATGQITSSIEEMRQSTARAVEGIHEGTGRVETGVKSAQEAGRSLSSIVEQARGVDELVRTIAAAASEQGKAVADITSSLAAVEKVARETADGAGSATHAASELAGKATRLASLVSRFKVG